jgi:hypothetical protein
MLRHSLVFVVAFVSAPSWADTPCKRIPPGALYPWQTSERMQGDQWATLSIDIDTKGRPLNCRIIAGYIKDDELGHWFCNAVTRDGRFDPVVKDGQPVAGTVTRTMTLRGRRHTSQDDAARKAFFRENPTERAACYPE